MPKLPRVTGSEAIRRLRRDGWQEVRQAGSHVQLRHAVKSGTVTVPLHAGMMLPPHVLTSILRQGGLTVAEFIAL